ncbi:MAG: nicotinate-nucleotide adenylyltransferase [Candidatus Binatia bacterium]
MCAEPAGVARAVRIGVLGGTFDPVHLGHLASAREIAAAFCLDRVLLVLSARPPHKPSDAPAAAEVRWRMLELAVEEARHAAAPDTLLVPCDIELRRSGPSWTVDTLRELGRLHEGSELFLILGIDAYEEIDTWSRPGEIPGLASIIVTTRPGRDFPDSAPLPPVAARPHARYDPAIGAHVHTSGHTIRGYRIRGIEVSATDIRRRVRSGLPIAHLTGEAVAEFIARNGLYRASVTEAGDPAGPSETTGTGRNEKS